MADEPVVDLAYMQGCMNDIFILKHNLKTTGNKKDIENLVDVLEFLAWKINQKAIVSGKTPDIKEDSTDKYKNFWATVDKLAQSNVSISPAKICCYLAISLCHEQAGCWCSRP
jgi:hypothetical protein